MTFDDAQRDMRDGYADGGAGVLASALVWLVAAAIAQLHSIPASVLALLAGGMLIHPLGLVIAKLSGRRGAHTSGNPLGRLAIEGTLWMLGGIATAYATQLLRLEWFFPAMLLVIGGRYLTFQTLYGLRIYWALGGMLAVLGLLGGLSRCSPIYAALAGGVAELGFGVVILVGARPQS